MHVQSEKNNPFAVGRLQAPAYKLKTRGQLFQILGYIFYERVKINFSNFPEAFIFWPSVPENSQLVRF